MSIDQLIAELESDPLARGYSGMSAAEVVVSLNTKDRVQVRDVYANERTILAAFANPADGEAVLQKLEAAAESNALVARAVKWLQPAQGGINLGDPSTRAILDALQAANVLTETEVATVKSIAEQAISRATEIGHGEAHEGDVAAAKGQLSNG